MGSRCRRSYGPDYRPACADARGTDEEEHHAAEMVCRFGGRLMSETVSILGGTGNLGFGLAVRLGVAGYSVCLGSRDPERARAAARRAHDLIGRDTVIGCLNDDAVARADR